MFLLLWNTAGLENVAKGPGPMTFFVPHDAAFVLALQSNLKTWMENKQILSNMLSYHVVAQAVDPTSIGNEPVNLTTLSGATIKVERKNGGLLTINGARVIGSPISGSNGTIYTIDQVLSPNGQ
ncbi:MAG: fasciclin domain-containing protein [Caldilineaceae bacterium]